MDWTANQIRNNIRAQSIMLRGTSTQGIGVSIGVANYDGHPDYQYLLGRAQDALLFSTLGDTWKLLPRAVQRGDVSVFRDWTPAQLVDVLHKICHDLLLVKAGAVPRFFEPGDLPSGGSWQSLTNWSKALGLTRRMVEHPFNVGLMQEALVSQAQSALNLKS